MFRIEFTPLRLKKLEGFVGHDAPAALCCMNCLMLSKTAAFATREMLFADYAAQSYLCPICGAIVAENEIHNLPCDCGKENYIKVIKAKILKIGARCGNCHTGHYKRLYLGNDAATAVLATSLYEELPEIEYVENVEQTKAKNIFARAVSSNKKVAQKTGRQFLAFSDSRQEAAKFACYLGKSYNEFLRRRGICRIIAERKDEIVVHEYTISDFVTMLTNYFTSKKSFAKSNSDESNLTLDSRKNAWVALLNELARYGSTTSLTALGQIQFEYKGNTPEIVQAIADEYSADPVSVKALLDLLIFEIVKIGAIYTDSDSIHLDSSQFATDIRVSLSLSRRFSTCGIVWFM